MTAPGLLEAARTVASEGGLSLGGFGLAWARLAPTLLLVPAFGMRGMPSLLRLAMAAQLALAVAPMMAGFPAEAGVRELVMEAVRGLPMAVLAAAPLWVATMTGGVLDGLRLFPRAEPERSGPFTTLTTLLASVAFLASGGPARVALAAMEVGDVLDPLARAIVAMTSGIGVAVALAAPIAIASMLVELGLALAARTAGATSLAGVLAPLRGVALLSVMGLLLERLASRLVHHAAR